MINREIMRILREKMGKSLPQIYRMIEERQKVHAVKKETAAYILAMESDINIAKFLGNDELREVREVKSPIIVRERAPARKTTRVLVPIRIEPDVEVKVPNLSTKVINEAKKMSRVYPYIYLFENSVRYLIMEILGDKYGNDWWEGKVSGATKREVKKRIDREDVHRWHAKRGAHPIFYSDMRDLYLIIVNNWDDFKNLFPGQAWIKTRIEEIELSRNIVAHNNPLPDDEITRLKLDLKAWVKQISK